MKTLEEHIDQVMESFDWEKVHKIMNYMNWQWTNIGIPEESDLKEKVQELMYAVHNHHGSTMSSGGFQVSYHRLPNDEDLFRVLFVLTRRETNRAATFGGL
jgi:hypothetical protein